MERHCGDLEAESADNKQDSDEKHPGEAVAPPVGGDDGYLQRPRQAIEQRNAVERQRRGERADEQVLGARFGRAVIVLLESDQRVAAERRQLQSDKQCQQVCRRGNDEHPQRGGQQQREELGAVR